MVSLLLGIGLVCGLGWVGYLSSRVSLLDAECVAMQDAIDSLTGGTSPQTRPLTDTQHNSLALGLCTLANLGATSRMIVNNLPDDDLVSLAKAAVDQFYSQSLAESLAQGRASGPAYQPPPTDTIEAMERNKDVAN